ncbi:MAG: hypothetical protein U0324_10580 [Polyangiales bacterium]
MGRDYYIINLLPRRMPGPDAVAALPRGMTHSADAPCPFAQDGHPTSSMGTCCSLRGEYLLADLEDHGELNACDQLQRDMGADQALRFSKTLREVADRLEAGGLQEPAWGAFAEPMATCVAKGLSHALLRNLIEGPLISIRTAADWYEKVARLGFGVECVR